MTRIPYHQVFIWHCTDCRQSGEVVVTFPCHPNDVVETVMTAHRKEEERRHCMCPAHYLSIQPKPLEL